MAKFKPGDIVTTVDGGPNMEVVDYLRFTGKQPGYHTAKGPLATHTNNLVCRWFDGNDSHLSTFDEDELVMIKASKAAY